MGVLSEMILMLKLQEFKKKPVILAMLTPQDWRKSAFTALFNKVNRVTTFLSLLHANPVQIPHCSEATVRAVAAENLG